MRFVAFGFRNNSHEMRTQMYQSRPVSWKSYNHRRRKPPGHPDMSGRPRGATRNYLGSGELWVIVYLYRGGSNYDPQAVGTALDFTRPGGPMGQTLYLRRLYLQRIVLTILIFNKNNKLKDL